MIYSFTKSFFNVRTNKLGERNFQYFGPKSYFFINIHIPIYYLTTELCALNYTGLIFTLIDFSLDKVGFLIFTGS
ncbi:MAG: hypothetical protein QMC93_03475, partial [Patescibacteria group bacterium]|nr:hypothetical protein [Patescibacteria group bacterium]